MLASVAGWEQEIRSWDAFWCKTLKEDNISCQMHFTCTAIDVLCCQNNGWGRQLKLETTNVRTLIVND